MLTLLKIFLRIFISIVVLVFAFSYIYNKWIQPDATATARDLAKEGEFITLDGVDFHFTRTGSGFNKIVLLHGFNSSTYTWRDVAEPLAVDATVYAIDLAGFGFSEKDSDVNYRTEARVGQLAKFFEQENIIQANIVGHGMGANLALAFAEDYPDKVNRMVLISPMTYRKSFPIPSFLMKIPQVSKTVIKLSHTDARLESTYKSMVKNPSVLDSSDVAMYALPFSVKGTEDALIAMATQRDTVTYDHTNPVAPIRILYGENDKTVPRIDVDRLRADLYKADLVTIENTGHLAQEEQPGIVVDEISKFFSGAIL